MLAELLDKMRELAEVNLEPKVTTATPEPPHVYYMNGTKVFADPQPRDNTALSLDPIFKLVGKQSAKAPALDYEVWYSHEGIVFFPDRQTRRDRVSMNLELSEQLAKIRSWPATGQAFAQTDLILLLRTLFKYSMSDCSRLLLAIRQLKFSNSNKADSTVTHGKASIGRTIESEVSGATDLPEDFVLTVPVFKKVFPAMTAKIEVCLDMNATAERLILYAVPQSIDLALAEAEVAIRNILVENLDDNRVLFGRP